LLLKQPESDLRAFGNPLTVPIHINRKPLYLVLIYPMTVGRNFDEVLRVIDSLQLGAKHKIATPVNWKQGDDVIIAGSVTDDDAKKLFPQGWKAP
jgi:hypothetical protein